jgi:hypothetical protein
MCGYTNEHVVCVRALLELFEAYDDDRVWSNAFQSGRELIGVEPGPITSMNECYLSISRVQSTR